jgi:hypothetical protein
MAGYTIQRSPSGPLEPRPRTDIELARDAWRYVSKKVENYRQKRDSAAGSSTKSSDIDSESIISKADTLVAEKSDMKKGKN